MTDDRNRAWRERWEDDSQHLPRDIHRGEIERATLVVATVAALIGVGAVLVAYWRGL